MRAVNSTRCGAAYAHYWRAWVAGNAFHALDCRWNLEALTPSGACRGTLQNDVVSEERRIRLLRSGRAVGARRGYDFLCRTGAALFAWQL